MKNLFYVALSVIFFMGLTTKVYSQVVQNNTENSIVFEKLVYDYGTIEQGSDGHCEFKFTNKGSTPIILSEVRASCGCTAPEWPKEPVAPGKSAVIKVKYNTNIVGAFNKSIMVQSNASDSPVVLRIQGSVTAKQ